MIIVGPTGVGKTKVSLELANILKQGSKDYTCYPRKTLKNPPIGDSADKIKI